MNDTINADSNQLVVFANASSFEVAQRMAGALSKSTMVPTTYQGNLPNCIIALEMATRLGASPLMVMQNLIVIHGRPSWSSQFIIAAINTCGRYSPLRFEMTGEGDKRTCTAWVIEKGSNDRLEGPTVSIQMAKDEGWYGKNGSKWKTMPELMLRYRAASFFGRLYAPEMLMGIHSQDEVEEMTETPVKIVRAAKIMDKFIEAAKVEMEEIVEAEIPMTAEEVAEVTELVSLPSMDNDDAWPDTPHQEAA